MLCSPKNRPPTASWRRREREPTMRCPRCQADMVSSIEDLAYVAGGRPDVILRNIEMRRCSSCDESVTVLQRIKELHQKLESVSCVALVFEDGTWRAIF